MHRLLIAGIAAAIPFAISCDSATRSSVTGADAKATVSVVGDSAIAVVSEDRRWMQFRLDVSVTNTGTVPIRFEYCASSVQRFHGGVWVTAWTPVCAASSVSAAELQPGQTLQQSVPVTASLSASGAPEWNGSEFPAKIRLNAGLIPHGLSGQIPQVASNQLSLVLKQ